jgi:hypothetical protein
LLGTVTDAYNWGWYVTNEAQICCYSPEFC